MRKAMGLTREDKEQIKALILPLLDDLNRMAFYLCDESCDAEDLVAETVRKACEKFHTLRDRERVKPWLFRILRNNHISMCRNRNSAKIRQDSWDENGESGFSLFTAVSQPILFWQGNPEKELLDKFLARDIQQAIMSLPLVNRLAVLLCDVEGYSYKEISELLKIPVGTVRSRISRGRSILQKNLYKHARDRGIISSKEGFYEKS